MGLFVGGEVGLFEGGDVGCLVGGFVVGWSVGCAVH